MIVSEKNWRIFSLTTVDVREFVVCIKGCIPEELFLEDFFLKTNSPKRSSKAKNPPFPA
jgi:hypothetical protein